MKPILSSVQPQKGLHILVVFLLIYSVIVSSSPAYAQGDAPLLFDEANSADVSAAPSPNPSFVVRSRFVRVNSGLLLDSAGNAHDSMATSKVTLNLFSDVSFIGQIDKVEQSDFGTSWAGTLVGEPNSYFYMVTLDDTFIAHVASLNGVYEVSSAGDDLYEVIEIDQSKLGDDYPMDHEDPGPLLSEADLGPNADSASQIDVMVVYTAAALAGEGSLAAMNARIALAMTETNTGYANAGVNTRLRLVHSQQISYTETGNISTDLSRLIGTSDGYMDNVHSLRNAYAADMVALIVENGGSYCGVASSIMATAANAFQVTVRSGCMTGYYTFAHEFGHLQGARHDIAVDPNTSPFAYGHGYVHTVAPKWRTIMAYANACGTCTRLNYWSNPNKSYLGAPMGASNARNFAVLNQTAATVANFRTQTTVAVPTPKQPAGTVSARKPTFKWTTVTGATQYQIQVRSGTTPLYTVLIGAGSCGSDCTNTPATSLGNGAYQWRVRAQGASGWGTWSAFKSFTVAASAKPSTPKPQQPAGAVGTRTPTFKWTTVTGATQYQIQVRSGSTVLYSVSMAAGSCASNCTNTPATSLSNGAYQWRVRARNANGWSAWSAFKSFNVSVSTGFNSQFTSNAAGWSNPSGNWTVNTSTGVYSSPGLANLFASTVHSGKYPTFDYQVRMRRTGDANMANAVVVRGKPTPFGEVRRWDQGYYFAYTNSGYYIIGRYGSGEFFPIIDWTYSSAINQNGWNLMRVTGVGSTLKFYINNTLITTCACSTLTNGQAGAMFYRGSAAGQLRIDYATLKTTVASDTGESSGFEVNDSMPFFGSNINPQGPVFLDPTATPSLAPTFTLTPTGSPTPTPTLPFTETPTETPTVEPPTETPTETPTPTQE